MQISGSWSNLQITPLSSVTRGKELYVIILIFERTKTVGIQLCFQKVWENNAGLQMTRTDTSDPGKSLGKQLMNELYIHTAKWAAKKTISNQCSLIDWNVSIRIEQIKSCLGEFCLVGAVLRKCYFFLNPNMNNSLFANAASLNNSFLSSSVCSSTFFPKLA